MRKAFLEIVKVTFTGITIVALYVMVAALWEVGVSTGKLSGITLYPRAVWVALYHDKTFKRFSGAPYPRDFLGIVPYDYTKQKEKPVSPFAVFLSQLSSEEMHGDDYMRAFMTAAFSPYSYMSEYIRRHDFPRFSYVRSTPVYLPEDDPQYLSVKERLGFRNVETIVKWPEGQKIRVIFTTNTSKISEQEKNRQLMYLREFPAVAQEMTDLTGVKFELLEGIPVFPDEELLYQTADLIFELRHTYDFSGKITQVVGGVLPPVVGYKPVLRHQSGVVFLSGATAIMQARCSADITDGSDTDTEIRGIVRSCLLGSLGLIMLDIPEDSLSKTAQEGLENTLLFLLYNNKIKAGMTAEDVRPILEKLLEEKKPDGL